MFCSQTNHLPFLLPDSPIKDNWEKRNNPVYTSTLDATRLVKAWYLPTGATFLDPCQVPGVNKETLGERCYGAQTGLVLAPTSYPSTSASPCPLCTPGMTGMGVFLSRFYRYRWRQRFFSCHVFAQHLPDRIYI